MSVDYEDLRQRVRELSTEALLEDVVDNPAEFTAEALRLREEELASRGVGRQEIERRRTPGDESDAGLVPVWSFDQVSFAQQARDVLQQEGIEALVRGRQRLLLGQEGSQERGAGTTLFVRSGDVERAREVLSTFPPAVEQGTEAGEP